MPEEEVKSRVSHHPGTHKRGHSISDCSTTYCGQDPKSHETSEVIREMKEFISSIAWWMQGDKHYDVKKEVDSKIMEARSLEDKIKRSEV